MILTVDEAVQVLKAMRNCLDPLRIKFGGDWRKDEALKMAIERMEVEELQNLSLKIRFHKQS